MFIRDTENFKPGNPATHVEFKRGEDLGGKILIILTPDDQLIPYSPKDHNDATQTNGIREGYTMVSMSCRTYYIKTLDQRNLQKGSRNPTQEEIDILFSSEIDVYVAEGFDPSKGDANTKWDVKLGHTKKTEILVLTKKIFGYGYEPYKPSQHGTNANEFQPITLNNYRATRSRARTKCDQWLEKNNNPTAKSNPAIIPSVTRIPTQTDIPSVTRIPTQTEIDILLSPGVDAYVAEGFDPSKGEANEKYDSRKHGNDAKILVLKKKIFGGGYQPYKLSQHGENPDEFSSVTANTYRVTRAGARKEYKKWVVKNNITNSNIDTTTIRLLPQIPTQREIDIFTSKQIDAYLVEGFDPNKGDDNEKCNTHKHCREDEILVFKKKLFGGGYEPYIPSKHGTNPNDFKSITVGYFITARSRTRKAYELWKTKNIVSPSATTSTTTTTSSSTISNPTASDREAVHVGTPDLFLDTAVSNPNTLFSTPSTISYPSNQVGPKHFNPILLINNYESIPETKEQGTDNNLTTSQTDSISQQRKRTADDSVLNSTPFFTRSSFALFQDIAEPDVSKDPTEPKRLRLND